MAVAHATNAASTAVHPTHPKGVRARVLLTSVFGPFAQDDEFGSRAINPMELYHNQVTRVQKGFSLRMFHRSWGIMLIQHNISAPCNVLDFPTRDRFIEELTRRQYDVIGITAIVANIEKARHMCELIRSYQPHATILIGGHLANIPDLEQRLDADYIVRGEGIRWMRRFLGENPDAPIIHPPIVSGFGTRAMGIPIGGSTKNTAATVIPSVGCPLGCDFCSTSAMFGGKGKFVHFYETGDALFDVMQNLERQLGVSSFFMMDENFLLHRKRVLRLHELMVQHNKAWALYVFSSARALLSYDIEQLVSLGISWVWMGIEGKHSRYEKLQGTDTLSLVRTLQEHGVRVLGSTIIGLDEHTPDNIDEAIDYAVSHDTEFHQFMLYTPLPGTPLHARLTTEGRMLSREECPEADIHGQYRFNYRHPHIHDGQETQWLLRAFQRDFDVNGPSIIRVARTTLKGWLRYKNHPDPRIRRRFAFEARELPWLFPAALWAARQRLRHNPGIVERIGAILRDFYREFGMKARLAAPLLGRYLHHTLAKEERRLENGWTYEPPTFFESCRWVTQQ